MKSIIYELQLQMIFTGLKILKLLLEVGVAFFFAFFSLLRNYDQSLQMVPLMLIACCCLIIKLPSYLISTFSIAIAADVYALSQDFKKTSREPCHYLEDRFKFFFLQIPLEISRAYFCY